MNNEPDRVRVLRVQVKQGMMGINIWGGSGGGNKRLESSRSSSAM